jgi:hypothetical protein
VETFKGDLVMANTIRIKRRSAGGGTGGPASLAASELAINETSGFRILYYGLGNDGFGTATSVIPIGGPDFNPPVDLTGPITSSNNVTSITSQTGTGTKFVVDNTPTLITPVLGVATVTSVNKVIITQPATNSTLTIADGATLSCPSAGSVSGTNTGDDATNSQYSNLITNSNHTGDATGATALTVVRINGQSLASLATGILFNTTSTGVPSIAVAGTDYVIPSGTITGNAANVTGIVAIVNGGTGETTQQAAINALTGTQGAGKFLRSDGNNSTLSAITAADLPNLTGVITSNSSGVTSITSQTGTGTKFVVDDSPVLITPDIGVAIGTSLVLSGGLTVNGTTTTLNSTTLDISDKNIVLGNVTTPSEATADGGGITLRSVSDRLFTYVASTTSWTSSENIDLVAGKVIKFAGTTVLSATVLDGVTIDGGSF